MTQPDDSEHPVAADRPEENSVAEPAPSPADDVATVSGLRQLTKVVGAVVAPTSLLTALAYYFGWSYAFFYFDYLGVNATVLDQGSVDYLINSVDSLFVPVMVAAFVALLALWANAPLRAVLAAGSKSSTQRVVLPAMMVTGLVLTLAGLWSAVSLPGPLNNRLGAAPLCCAVGVLLLAYTVQLRRSVTIQRTTETRHEPPAPETSARQTHAPQRPAPQAAAEWAVIFAIISICLFWAAQQYAPAVGRERAHELVASLPYRPPVVLYSRQSLSLNGPGVSELRCGGSDTAFHYRYDGLRLILKSGGQYLFLPERWSPGQGVAFLIPRTDSVRLEFRPVGTLNTPAAATC